MGRWGDWGVSLGCLGEIYHSFVHRYLSSVGSSSVYPILPSSLPPNPNREIERAEMGGGDSSLILEGDAAAQQKRGGAIQQRRRWQTRDLVCKRGSPEWFKVFRGCLEKRRASMAHDYWCRNRKWFERE